MPSSAFETVASGVATQRFDFPGSVGMSCEKAAVPVFAMADGRIAYSRPGSVAGDPDTVVVHAMGTLARDLRFDASAHVVQLALSADAVAWVESGNGRTNGNVIDWRLMQATLGDAAAMPVDIGETADQRKLGIPPTIALAGSTLIASRDVASAVAGTTVRVDAGYPTIDPGANGRSCSVIGATGAVVVLACDALVRDPSGSPVPHGFLAAWSQSQGLRAIAVGPLIPEPTDAWVRDGWLVWFGVDRADSSVLDFAGIPLTALEPDDVAPTSPAPSPTASPEPTLPDWAGQLGMPIAAVLPSAVRTLTPPDPLTDVAGGAVTGPFSYAVSDTGAGTGTGATIEVVDIGGGSVRSVPSPASATEGVTQLLAGDGWLVASLSSPAGNCPPTGTATTWRIVAAPIGADGMPGAFGEVDAGAMTGKELPFELPGFAYTGTCSDPYSPPLALTGNRLAWAVPASGAADAGSVVKVQWLDTPDVAKVQLVARTRVLALALSADAIAWVESSNGLANGGHASWRVLESDGPVRPLARMAPVNIGQTASAADHALPDIFLDGAALIVTRSYPGTQSTSIARVSGGRVEVLTAKQDSHPCWAFAAAYGRVLMECAPYPGLVTWTATGGLRALVVGTSFVDPSLAEVWVRNRWVGGIKQSDSGPPTYFAIPLDAIETAAP